MVIFPDQHLSAKEWDRELVFHWLCLRVTQGSVAVPKIRTLLSTAQSPVRLPLIHHGSEVEVW